MRKIALADLLSSSLHKINVATQPLVGFVHTNPSIAYLPALGRYIISLRYVNYIIDFESGFYKIIGTGLRPSLSNPIVSRTFLYDIELKDKECVLIEISEICATNKASGPSLVFGAEDFRIFLNGDTLFLIGNTCEGLPINQSKTFLVEFDLVSRKVRNARLLLGHNDHLCQKNWVPVESDQFSLFFYMISSRYVELVKEHLGYLEASKSVSFSEPRLKNASCVLADITSQSSIKNQRRKAFGVTGTGWSFWILLDGNPSLFRGVFLSWTSL
jgi:hypothetical protein